MLLLWLALQGFIETYFTKPPFIIIKYQDFWAINHTIIKQARLTLCMRQTCDINYKLTLFKF